MNTFISKRAPENQKKKTKASVCSETIKPQDDSLTGIQWMAKKVTRTTKEHGDEGTTIDYGWKLSYLCALVPFFSIASLAVR
jgi:hypothetical protein